MTELEAWNDSTEQLSRKSRRGGKRRRHNPNAVQLNEEFRDSLP